MDQIFVCVCVRMNILSMNILSKQKRRQRNLVIKLEYILFTY